jgi:hypothetical protein
MRCSTPRLRLAQTALVAVLLVLPATLRGQGESDKRAARGFVESIAATVYGAAWPTATYGDWEIERIDAVRGGVDAVVKLSGKSGFGGGDLWMLLVFEFRNGAFSDIRLVSHNAILSPPFTTLKTLAGVVASIGAPAGSGPSAGPPPQPPVSAPRDFSPPPMATRQLFFTSNCSRALKLWVRSRRPDNVWETRGPWAIPALDSTFLADDQNRRIELSSTVVYYYAEIPGTDLSWHGTRSYDFGGKSLAMRTDTLPDEGSGTLRLTLSCPMLAPSATPAPSTGAQRVVGVLLRDVDTATWRGQKYPRVIEVTGLQHGLPAKEAGIRVGDVILRVNGNAVGNTAGFQQMLRGTPGIPVLLTLLRDSGEELVTIRPVLPPSRSPVDMAACRAGGNPPDYYLGALAAPFMEGGEPIVPLYPGAAGRLFDPKELDLHVRTAEPWQAWISHNKVIRDDIASLEYRDRDRAILVVLKSGEFLDLGVRIHCLVLEGLMKVTEVRLSRTQDNKEISATVVPLKVVP